MILWLMTEQNKNNERLRSKGRALKSFIERGSKLAEGQKYELVNPKEDDYRFLIYKYISLKPGAIHKVKLTQEIPPSYQGYLFSIDIAGFENVVWGEVNTGDEKAK